MNKSDSVKYLNRYLKNSPLGLAVWRAVEARHMSKIKMESPILDIGCGFGEFAQAFVDDKIDVGVDINARDLYIASKTGKFKNLLLADARDLPFPDNTFSTIMSVSTFEHIDNPKKLLKECYRVLKNNGKLVVTIETDKVDRSTFYRPFFTKIGLKVVEKYLTAGYNNMFGRHTLLDAKKWQKMVEQGGFKIDKFENIVSPEATKLFDIMLITSWPSQILKVIFGKRIVHRPEFVNKLLIKYFVKYVQKDSADGTNLLIVARKVSRKN
ncbi:class I SAM-dependent methyltransferase [Patescibacteria group bacterium]|nr:class I SAM-dependent methyltransferase [Patescibacteria group bacterium]